MTRLLIAVAVVLATAAANARAAAEWTTVGDMTEFRYASLAPLSAHRLSDGRVFVAGGWDNTTELFSGSGWRAGPTMSEERDDFASVALSDGVLVIGGFHYGSAVEDVERFNGSGWALAAPMSTPRWSHAAATLADGTVLVSGGADGINPGTLASAERFNPTTNSWSNAGTMGHARSAHALVPLGNGKVLAVGGLDAELYTPSSNSWSAAGTMVHNTRGGPTATLLHSGKVLVANGGRADSELYDPDTNTFGGAATMAVSRLDSAATLLADGRVLVTGGSDGSNDIATAELYDPDTNSWSTTVPMFHARSNHGSVLLTDGRILVVGGDSTGKSTEIFTPPPYPGHEPPTNFFAPAISVDGGFHPGHVAHCSQGTWSGADSFAYQWYRSGIVPIVGATASDYTLAADDADLTLTCKVTATNDNGSTTVTSAGRRNTPPATPFRPTVKSGANPEPGVTLTCDEGTWSGDPTFAYRWFRDTGSIGGATQRTYVMTDVDAGHDISCEVTATNPDGSTTVTSEPVHTQGTGPFDVKVPADGPPIIFIPGFLASEIECKQPGDITDNLWPDALWDDVSPVNGDNFGDMMLAKDGRSPADPTSPCNRSAASNRRALHTIIPHVDSAIGPLEIHAHSTEWIATLGKKHGLQRPGVEFGWDWRKGPEDNVGALDDFIDDLRRLTGQKQVVIVTHSYGGNLIRYYTDDPDRAKKVVRVVDFGTPWWGTPKPWFPVAYGVETPLLPPPAGSLDLLIDNDTLRLFARNLTGIYNLFPSPTWFAKAPPKMRKWLKVGGEPQDADGVARSVAQIGGNRVLLERAYATHVQHVDGFKQGTVKWEVLVGSGVPTVGPITVPPMAGNGVTGEVLSDFGGMPYWASEHSWINGDGTVALTSQRQAAPGDKPFTRDGEEPPPIHYFCGIGHMDEPETPALEAAVEGFILNGTPVKNVIADEDAPGAVVKKSPLHSNPCSLDASDVTVNRWTTVAPTDTTVYDETEPFTMERSVGRAAAKGMTVTEAEAKRLIQVRGEGGYTEIVTTTKHRLRIEAKGTGMTIETAHLTDAGAKSARSYGPVSGTVDVRLAPGATPTASRGGRKLKARPRDTRPPRTTAKIRRHGMSAFVTFRAHDPAGVSATYYAVGKKGGKVQGRKPVKVPVAKLKRLRYFSVDRFGNVEAPRKTSRR